MKTPKFKIGDTFYTTHWLTGSSDKRMDENRRFFHLPACGVVTKIIITKKNIYYVLKEYIKHNVDVTPRELEILEENLIENPIVSQNPEDIIKAIAANYLSGFRELTKEANKEKLRAVLHGE